MNNAPDRGRNDDKSKAWNAGICACASCTVPARCGTLVGLNKAHRVQKRNIDIVLAEQGWAYGCKEAGEQVASLAS